MTVATDGADVAEAQPSFRDIRRWTLQQASPIRPADLMRQFRLTRNQAAALLEELERDHVLSRLADGSYSPWKVEPPRRRDGRILRDTSIRKDRRADETCEICGWSIPPALRKRRRRSSGCHDHHVVPVSLGGSNHPLNRILLCPNHHQLAHTMFPVTNGEYRGPRDKHALAKAIREAEAAPDEHFQNEMVDAASRLPVFRAEKTSGELSAQIAEAELWRRLRGERQQPYKELEPACLGVPRRMIRRHVLENHPGGLRGCPLCYVR